MPTDQTSKAFQELALKYESTVDQELQKAWGLGYSDFVEQLLQFAGIAGQCRVLDIATGTGLIPRTMAPRLGTGARIVGLDITYAVLEIGKSKIASSQPDPSISLTCATATALPFGPGSFDCVICALATHHIDQQALLAQISSVLKPGGQVILADVVASPSWRFPGVRTGLRLAAFIYFLLKESPARAWVESQAVSYVHTEEEWMSALRKQNFTAIRVCQPSIRRTWAPSAVMMAATMEGQG